MNISGGREVRTVYGLDRHGLRNLPVCAGDEVLEWNGRSLEHKSYDEVHDVIAESRYDSQVELRVSRMLSAPGAGAGTAAAAAAAAAGMAGHGHPIRGGPVPARPLAAPTGTRIQVGKVVTIG